MPMFLQHYLGQDDQLQLSAVELDPVVPKAARQCMGLDLEFGQRKAGMKPLDLSLLAAFTFLRGLHICADQACKLSKADVKKV